MSHRRPTLIVLLIVTALLAATGGGAVAARLVGSRDVVDNSLRSIDVRNGTLNGRDVRNGGLTAADFSGPPPAGARANNTYTWTATFTATGEPSAFGDPLVTSTDMLPAGAHLQGLDIDVAGDFSGCTELYVVVNPVTVDGWRQFDATLAEADVYNDRVQRWLEDVQLRPTGPTPLGVFGTCYDEDSDEIPVPSFSVTVKFALTRLTTPKAVEFN